MNHGFIIPIRRRETRPVLPRRSLTTGCVVCINPARAASEHRSARRMQKRERPDSDGSSSIFKHTGDADYGLCFMPRITYQSQQSCTFYVWEGVRRNTRRVKPTPEEEGYVATQDAWNQRRRRRGTSQHKTRETNAGGGGVRRNKRRRRRRSGSA